MLSVESSINEKTPSTNEPTAAVEYVRMSTDLQQYSTTNQSQAIHEYAARHGFKILKTYEDSGKSGLNLDDRDALKLLIDDVQSGGRSFRQSWFMT
jgi:DNA invertase Pin-like site-specific DNA recombinase